MSQVSVVMESDKKLSSTEDRIFDIICKEDDLSWKDMVYDLVRKEQMDPWNVDVTIMAEKFLVMLKQLKEMDFRIGGKVVLASSLLLKLKSDKLIGDDLQNFEKLLNDEPEEFEDEFIDEDSYEFEQTNLEAFLNDQKKIVPRTPQPRERKVSVFDLVDALEKALNTDVAKQRKRILQQVETPGTISTIPKMFFDLTKTMETMRDELKKISYEKETILFHDLLKTSSREDKVFTFMPLLHLENQRKVSLEQEDHFGDITVHINKDHLDEKV